MADFTDKTLLVLGGSRGIGAAIVLRFDGDGARVSFTRATLADATKALAKGSGVAAMTADSASCAEVVRAVSKAGDGARHGMQFQPTREHGERGAARAGGYGHEPRRWPAKGHDASADGDPSACDAQGNRGNGRPSRERGSGDLGGALHTIDGGVGA